MKLTQINYYISENYIPHWTIEDAFRELHQNFKDYGEYNIEVVNKDPETDFILLSNSFDPKSTDLLIIGESNKSENQIGKYGEGLKMAALVLLRNNYECVIHTNTFKATFLLVDNLTTKIKTLGVNIHEYSEEPRLAKDATFNVEITAPVNSFTTYNNSIIKPEDILHTREGFGSIVDKPKGDIYVGDLFVCNLKPFNYAYNLYPKNITLDRDRKVPKDFDVKWNISKIQETYKEFDKIGKSADVKFATIPNNIVPYYKPKLIADKIVFVTDVIDKEGNKKVTAVSDDFNHQLTTHSYFSQIVFKLKKLITSSLGVDELAKNFLNTYCNSENSKKEFKILMHRFGITFED